ncbi:MAG: hypothetical protein QF486_03785 [Candidatus Woesearchaeota archaeon]|nr:hypothetical protein [Candidatus Woesearchaeota archaeon]MDP7181628.1 hypothetical protein [Candidatus Woesearchaeota archaeon]MDP7198717.1 hypothetical protein [Candidatus Woesearchaeota archaeon]MDP7467283.1 hypothetical protein [Candidatus Woesearchaeota archaeon]MDP7647382.1 hypothetical protein [Candidatus Woesearchaeota archaeon]
MAKFPEAEARLRINKFVCRRCKTVMRGPSIKFVKKEIKCRSCAGRAFKAKRKK